MTYPPKMDRRFVEFGTHEKFDNEDSEYWSKATYEEKLMMVTFLRECFYGPEATTGKMKREFRIVRMGEADDKPANKMPMDNETFVPRASVMRVFRKAVKKAIKENKKFGID
jgi:hypothetical protein